MRVWHFPRRSAAEIKNDPAQLREEHMAPMPFTLVLTETAKGASDHGKHHLRRRKALERANELGITGPGGAAEPTIATSVVAGNNTFTWQVVGEPGHVAALVKIFTFWGFVT